MATLVVASLLALGASSGTEARSAERNASSTLKAMSSDASTISSIRLRFVVERAPDVSAQNGSARNIDVQNRVSPLVAVANRSFGAIGYRIDVVDVSVVDSITGADMESALRALRAGGIGADTAAEYDGVIGVLNGERPGSELGLAYPFTICDRKNAFAVVAWLGDGATEVERAGASLAHELGHMLGAEHDSVRLPGGLASLMHPIGYALMGGFSGRSEAEMESLLARLGSGPTECVPSDLLLSSGVNATVPDELIVNEGASLQWTVAMGDGPADPHPPTFISVSGLPAGASYSVPEMTVRYQPGFDVVPVGATEAVFPLTVHIEQFSGELVRTVLLRVRTASSPLTFEDGEVTVLDLEIGRRLRYASRVASGMPSGKGGRSVALSCSKAPKGLRRRAKNGRVTLTGRVRQSGTVICDATAPTATGTAQGRKIIVINAQAKSKAPR